VIAAAFERPLHPDCTPIGHHRLMATRSNRRRLALIAAASLGVCLVALVYRGPGWRLLRHTGGDVFAAALLYALIGLALARWRRTRRVTVALAIAAAIEFAQLLALVGPDAPRWVHIVLGATFDPLDLLAYAAGIGLAACIDSPVCTAHSEA